MRHRHLSLAVIVLLSLCVGRANAWHKQGHMITAVIAYDQLDPASRDKLVDIIKQHPRFDKDLKSAIKPNMS